MTTDSTYANPADVGSCGCSDFSSSRRRFLQGAAAIAGAGVFTAVNGSAFTQVAFAEVGVATDVLVVLSLRGGADGLSMVVPYGEANYYEARQHIGIPGDQLLQTDGTFGLHPAFKPMEQLWIDGKFAAVHAVGLKEANRSHFDAMEQIEDADPGSEKRVGWLNRLISLDVDRSPLQAVQMGSPIVPTSLYGKAPVLAVSKIDDMFLPARENGHRRRVASLREAWRDVPTPLGRGSRAAIRVSKKMELLAGSPAEPHNDAVYRVGDLGFALAEAARLLRANLGAQVITVDSGTWDLHTGMGDYAAGGMQRMVDELAGNVAAFFQDLGELGDRVTVVTISEFGRRLAENANRGLDHGYGNVMLLAGAGVIGGYYARSWPGLDPANLVEGDLAKTTDYRSVLAEVVRSRFGSDTSKVFPRFKPESIGCMQGG